jgi:hypothetical protein
MSSVKDSTTTSDLREDFLYHATEASWYMNQFLQETEEAENSFAKYKEHAMYRDEFKKRLWEESPCA